MGKKENKFELSSAYWESCFASMADGVVVVDKDLNVLYGNPAVTDITGYTSDDDIEDIFRVNDRSGKRNIIKRIKEAIKTEKKMGLMDNTKVIIKSGEDRYLSASIAPTYNKDKKCTGAVIVFRDITRIKSNELSVRNEQIGLNALISYAPVGIILIDDRRYIAKINDMAKKYLHVEEDDPTGVSIMDLPLFCPRGDVFSKCTKEEKCNDCLLRIAVDRALDEGGSTPDIELSRKNPNTNKLNWYKLSITPVIISNKPYVSILISDITISKEREQKYIESRDFYSRIFENAPMFVWRIDNDNKCDYMNKSCREFFGLESDKISIRFDKETGRLVHPDDRELVTEMFMQGSAQDFEAVCRVQNKNGEYRWIDLKSAVSYNDKYEPDGFICMANDITIKKQAEEGLERYKLLTDKIHDAVIICDIDANIIQVNKAALDIYGYSEEEFLKLSMHQLRGDNVKNERRIATALKEGIYMDTKHRLKNGQWISVEISSKGTSFGEQPAILNIIRDVSQQKEQEHALKQAKQAAESANKAKSLFLANMSHEIRTPLNAIVGMIDLTFLTDLTQEQHENLTIVKDSVGTLLNVINDILDFSKMEAGKLVIDNVSFDLHELIQKTVKVHSANANSKGIGISYAFSSDLPTFVNGDPNRISQILNNLLSNAIKFSEDGEIIVKAKTVTKKEDMVELEFSVQDHGVGISNEDIQKIFKSFVQADNSFTRKVGGTGLGLAICKQLTEMMGGYIWIDSKIGEGSTFYFTLKLQTAEEPNHVAVPDMQTPVALKKNSPPKKILLAEDNKVSQFVMRKILAKRNYEVDVADDGNMVLDKYRTGHYDLILMDIQMPVVDGITATKEIRKTDDKTPIIALTAYALQGDRERFMSHGMNGYLSKPVDAEKLYDLIDRFEASTRTVEDISKASLEVDENGVPVLKI